jgi:hypothetical protein
MRGDVLSEQVLSEHVVSTEHVPRENKSPNNS